MPIEFRCSNCNRLLRTGDGTVGLQAECPECGALTTVPEPSPEMNPPPGFDTWPSDWQTTASGASWETDDRIAALRVAGPANALMVLAGIIFVLQSLAVLAHSWSIVEQRPVFVVERPEPEWLEPVRKPEVAVFIELFGLAISTLVFVGAYRMKHLRNHRLAEVAAVVAIIPCFWSCCCLISMPLGIWALAVLEQPSVKAAFRS